MLAVKNVQHGMTTPDGRFIPFRGSSDYDPSHAGEPKKWGSKWQYEDKPRKRKTTAKRKRVVKKTVKRAAKKTTAKRATAKRTGGGLRAYALAASKSRSGGRRGVAMSRNPGRRPAGAGLGSKPWKTHPYLVVVKSSNGSPVDSLEAQFTTLAAAKKYGQALRSRGLSAGRVVEIYKFGDNPGLVSSKQNPSSGPRGTVDKSAARELYLYITSDTGLYNQQHKPIIINLQKKLDKGIYDHEKAVKLFKYLADNGAKKYAREYGGAEHGNIFNVPTRLATARMLADYFKREADLGNYKGMKNPIPAKWTQAKVMRTKTGDIKVMLTGRTGRR